MNVLTAEETPKPRCEGCLMRPATHRRLVRQYGLEDTLWMCDVCDPDYDEEMGR